MPKYGLISETDARTLEKTIDLICQQFPGETINTLEIGVFDGQTSRGIYEYVTSKVYLFGSNISEHTSIPMNSAYFKCNHTCIDNEKDKLIKLPFPECKFIRGNSNEVYNQIEDNSQHLIFVDGNHSFPYVVSDYYCYRHKVMVGGYLAFHDCADHIKEKTDWQRMGSEEDGDMYISVKKALQAVGLIDGMGKEMARMITGFEMVLYDADINNPAGGIAVFKRIR